MAVIGRLGNITFAVSKKKIKTFNEMNWTLSPKIATHERHLKTDLIEFTGLNAEEMKFDMILSVFLGVTPNKELKKLIKATRECKSMALTIGKKKYGRYKWVISNLSIQLQKFDNKGNLLHCKVSVSLKESAKR